MTEVNGHFELVVPKNGKSRSPFIPENLSKELKLKTLATASHSPIFTSNRGQHLRHSNFSKRHFKPAAKRAGLDPLTFHELRHTAISQTLAAGADILTLSKIAGHNNPAVTLNVYSHQIGDSALKVSMALNELLIQNEAI